MNKKLIQSFVILAMLFGMFATTSAAFAASCGTSVTVVAGDTLRKIAAKFGTTVDAILKLNPGITNPNVIYVGQAISIPAICLGMAKQAWQPTLDRTSQRMTFQRPLSERQTQQMRLGRMAVDLFAMEALAYSVWRMADQHSYDVRIEAAITKIFCSEHTIQFLKDAQVIFGGMGYETADSKRFRGEPAFGIEQLVRDAEMYRIGEGATDVMRPFVAREGLSPHLERAQRYLKGPSKWERLVELFKLVRFYAPWYIGLWRRRRLPERAEFRHPKVVQLLGYVEYTSRRLASAIFWAMVRHGEQLRDDQGRQTRMEMIGEHLLTIATVALEAASPAYAKSGEQVWELVDHVAAQPSGIEQRADRHHRQQDRQRGALRGIVADDDVHDVEHHDPQVQRHVPGGRPLGLLVGDREIVDEARDRRQQGPHDAADHRVVGDIIPDRSSPAGGVDDIAHQREDPEPDGQGDQHGMDRVILGACRTGHRRSPLLWISDHLPELSSAPWRYGDRVATFRPSPACRVRYAPDQAQSQTPCHCSSVRPSGPEAQASGDLAPVARGHRRWPLRGGGPAPQRIATGETF